MEIGDVLCYNGNTRSLGEDIPILQLKCFAIFIGYSCLVLLFLDICNVIIHQLIANGGKPTRPPVSNVQIRTHGTEL